jgi:molybdopterin-containing oxidoreductase family iron-sulfur binding subunit
MHDSTISSHSADGHGCGDGDRDGVQPAVSPTKTLWRSIDDKENTAEFQLWLQREFPDGASEATDEDRRDFMKFMGASVALAGLAATGCRRLPEQYIFPYASRPEGHRPGETMRYASSYELDGVGRGLLVTSVDGRPIKVDGHPEHPSMLGGSDSITQATVLELYDPERSLVLRRKGVPSSIAAFRDWCTTLPAGGRGVAILAEPSESPTRHDLKTRFLKRYPEARWVEWSPTANDAERRGTEIAFGRPMRPQWKLGDAAVVVALDCDFLLTHPNAVRNAKDFARGRRIDNPDPALQTMSRLYAVESAVSLTGMNADERIAARSCDVGAVFAAVLGMMSGEAGSLELPKPAADAVVALAGRVALSEPDRKIAEAMARDLLQHRGRSLVVVGPGQPPEIHALAALVNDRLGNHGSTIVYTAAGEPGTSAIDAFRQLVAAMRSGAVTHLVILGGNPVYTAPADFEFASALAACGEVVHLSYHFNETSAHAACTWHVPQGHYLETWGDSRAWDGTIAPQQPLIEPLIPKDQGGLSALELLAHLAGDEVVDGYALVRRAWMAETGTEGVVFEKLWRETLATGILPGSGYAPTKPSANGAAVAAAIASSPAPGRGIEVTFAVDPKVHDGRFANVAWLQELPHPVTKVTWDNVAEMSIGTAESIGAQKGDLVRIAVRGRTLEAAAWPVPGMADDSIRLALGYGRTGDACGTIARDAGFDAYRLRASDALSYAVGATLTRLGTRYPLAHTQDHGAMEALIPSVPLDGIQARLPAIFREDDLGTYRVEPDFAKHRTHVAHRLSLWEETNLDGAKFRWAMSIDLGSCTGCGACVTACQAENNIPVVGKDQVMRGREMHWIRIDRYFKGDDPKRPLGFALQPVTCLHCENAPCEQVCPVAATVHDIDGLNVMVYNRCIGTRYCSNNCPYKVRRFNFFDWHRRDPVREGGLLHVKPEYYVKDGPADRLRMQFNPDVTVRMRGVMEKCTFCVQRIQQAKIDHKNAWTRAGGAKTSPDWRVPDGSFTTACAEACPSEAIVFGDLNDPQSRVAKLHKTKRSYELLEELNTKPRLKYLAKVRNPSVTFDHRGHKHDHGDGEGHGHSHGSAAPVAGQQEVRS